MFDAEIRADAPRLRPQPGEVWSLWEMLRAYAHEFCLIDRTIRYVMNNCPANELLAQGFEQANGRSWRAWSNDQLQEIAPLFAPLPLGPSVHKQLQRTLAIFRDPAETHVAYDAITQLQSRFRDELEDLFFLHVSPSLADGLGEAPPFGETVDQAFPGASMEIRDAARCLALGQGTASVFHCMRALEPALRALGAEFGVEMLESDNWNSVLNDIQTAVRDRENSKRRPHWKEDEPYYMEACTHFFIIKNAWRNHTMHLKLRFTEQEALRVYEHTRTFMQHLATRLSEDVEGASPEQGAS